MGNKWRMGGHKGRRVVLIFCLIRFELEHNSKGQLKCSYVRVAAKCIQGPNFPLCVPDLIPPPTPSLNSPWSLFLLHYHMLHYLLNSPAISLTICSPPLHSSLPLPLSLAVSDLLLSGLCPRISSILPSGFIECWIVEFHRQWGVIGVTMPKV